MWRETVLSPFFHNFTSDEGLEKGGGDHDHDHDHASLSHLPTTLEATPHDNRNWASSRFDGRNGPSPTARSQFTACPPGLPGGSMLPYSEVPSSTLAEHGCDDYQQVLQDLLQVQQEFNDQLVLPKEDAKGNSGEPRMDVEGSWNRPGEAKCVLEKRHDVTKYESQCSDALLTDNTESQQILKEKKVEVSSATISSKPSDDGYTWRKYGQKQVKGGEYPRSYYKCTHPRCEAKKKIERALNGVITQIIYSCNHNHPRPQPTRRSALVSPQELNMKTSNSSVDLVADWRPGDEERTLLASTIAELSNTKRYSSLLTDNLDPLSTQAYQNDDEEDATKKRVLFPDDDTEAKRRKKESCFIEASPASHPVHEQKVVIKTTSEVDILEDGYRWRKYGQKVVKGNPNPRSYYKCTNPGCSVRKHVERAADDPKSVLTTYEGKHSHGAPPARNNYNISSDVNMQTPDDQKPVTIYESTQVSNLETESQNLVPRSEINLDDINAPSKFTHLGSVVHDSNTFVSPSGQLVHGPFTYPWQPSGPFSWNGIPIEDIGPRLPTSFCMGTGTSDSNLAGTGYDHFNGKPIIPDFQCVTGQQSKGLGSYCVIKCSLILTKIRVLRAWLL